MHESQQEEANSTQQPTSEHQGQAIVVNSEGQADEESNIFDILNTEVGDIGEDDSNQEEHVDDIY